MSPVPRGDETVANPVIQLDDCVLVIGECQTEGIGSGVGKATLVRSQLISCASQLGTVISIGGLGTIGQQRIDVLFKQSAVLLCSLDLVGESAAIHDACGTERRVQGIQAAGDGCLQCCSPLDQVERLVLTVPGFQGLRLEVLPGCVQLFDIPLTSGSMSAVG